MYTADGAVRWRRQLGWAGGEQFSAVTTDVAGDVVAAGYVQAPGRPDDLDVLVAEYASDGRLLWKRRLGTTTTAEWATSVLIDPGRATSSSDMGKTTIRPGSPCILQTERRCKHSDCR